MRRPTTLFLLLILLSGCRPKPIKPVSAEASVDGDKITIPANSPQLAALTLEPVGSEPISFTPLTGRLVWNEDVTARVFTPFAGIVRKLLVEVNESVTNGMPLAEIHSADFDQAVADARKAESDFRRAGRNLDRLKDLFAHGSAARKDLDGAEADYATAEAEKVRAESRLAIYGANSQATGGGFLLPSPLPGVVVERNVNPGQEIRPDQMLANSPQFTAPLFVVTDPSRLWLLFDATEADVSQLKTGGQFICQSRAFPGQNFTGRVEVISRFIDPATRTMKVRGSVDNSKGQLKAEMFVTATLPPGEAKGATVPARAVFLKGRSHYVFVEEQPGQFVRREIQIGTEQSGRILVEAGLQPGQRVVMDGCVLLQQLLR